MKKALVRGTARLVHSEEDGATMVEYALMLVFIAAVCIAAVTIIGTNTSTMFNQIAGSL